MSISLIKILEVIGIIAFAISGALVAMEKKMDLFGVCILGMTTAVGGGIIRDLILDITPPTAFKNPSYAILAIIVSIFCIIFKNKIKKNSKLVLVMDTLGLSVFVVVGTSMGMEYNNLFLSVFVGSLSGVGGGVLRDLFVQEKPSIFVKHFYACAAIIGSLVCALLYSYNKEFAMFLGATIVGVLRILAAKYHWSLPIA